MPTLRLRDFLPAGAAYHVARVRLERAHRPIEHDHDFAEVFWVEHGEGVHVVGGERRPLRPGDLVLMRPSDRHTFRPRGERGLVQVNIAFDRGTLDFLRRRYFEDAAWPWAGDALPATYALDADSLARFRERAALLFAGPPTRLALERFLLALLHDLAAPPRSRPGLPPWLNAALGRLAEDPEALAAGVPALARLAGRSREHVNRVARRGAGLTATELVQQLRLDRAAADLRLTELPVSRIAFACGIASPSHFHRLFRARFGLTPRRYRLAHQALVRGSPAGR